MPLRPAERDNLTLHIFTHPSFKIFRTLFLKLLFLFYVLLTLLFVSCVWTSYLPLNSTVADIKSQVISYHNTPYHNIPYHNTPYHNTPYHTVSSRTCWWQTWSLSHNCLFISARIAQSFSYWVTWRRVRFTWNTNESMAILMLLIWLTKFYVLLTVHISVTLVNDQLDAQFFYFI